MNIRRPFLVIFTGLGALLLLGTTLALLHPDATRAAPAATVRYVSATYGNDSSDCTDAQHPCKTIQYALAQAAEGDEIHVHLGVYTATLAITRSVTLQGGWGVSEVMGWLSWMRSGCNPDGTVLDGEGAGRVIQISGNVTPVIDCFTVTGGDATGLGGSPTGDDAGGGIYGQDAAPIFINSIISGNLASSTGTAYGGGIYLRNAPATAVISNNVITHNVAAGPTSGIGRGGGIYLGDSSVQVLSNTIGRNRAGNEDGYGGGIAVEGGQPIIADNLIFGNTGALGGKGIGGGIYIWSGTPATVERNEIAYNIALFGSGSAGEPAQGGGLYYAGNPSVAAIIRGNYIHDNIATASTPPDGEGGGIYLFRLSSGSVVEGNRLESNVAGHNGSGKGGGAYVAEGDLTLAHNTFTDNSANRAGGNTDKGWGGGLYAEGGALTLQNNVITANFGSVFSGFPNQAEGYGGGIALSDTLASVVNNTIVGNVGTRGDNVGTGGGIYGFGGRLEIRDNLIADNQTSEGTDGSGGGLYLQNTVLIMERNLILRNRATGSLLAQGGGMRIATCSAFTLTNNIVAQNEASEQGSGVAIFDSAGSLAHNTIAENFDGIGVGVEVHGGTVVLSNTILVDNAIGITVIDGGTAILESTLWDNGLDWGGDGTIVTGTHNYWGSPAFVNPADDNYHLRAGSAAIDVGVDAGVNTDIDGEPRPRGSAPDLGADEFTCLARVGSTDYPSVQQAVNAAPFGGTVQVAEGVCYENVSIGTGKSVTLEGGWNTTFTARYADPATRTTIDGAGLGRVIDIAQATVALDGLTLTGGDATGLGGSGIGYDVGGGVYGTNSTVTVANCVVTDNVASRSTIGWGGGLGFVGGSVTLSNTQVLSNVASTASNGYGGGAYFRSDEATVINSTVEENIASTTGFGRGGGIAFHFVTDATFRNTLVRGNRTGEIFQGQGGGLYVYASSLDMEGDRLEGNLASSMGYGGGLFAEEHSTLLLKDVTVAGNTADNSGGGLYVFTSTLTISGSAIYNNATGNGGGIFLDDTAGAVLMGNEVYSNTAMYNGGGIYLWQSSNGTLTGNRVFGNLAGAGGGGIALGYGGGATIEGNEVFGNGAEYGGGCYLFYSDDIVLRNNDLQDNEARESGGGIFALSSHNLSVVDNELYNNEAWESGGGIYALSSLDLSVEDNDLHANEATSGGGISIAGSRGEIAANRIYGNIGGLGSSAVEIHSSSPVTLTRNLVYDNNRGNTAVWLYDNGASIYLLNNIVAENTPDDGQGIEVSNSTAYFVHNTLARNTSPSTPLEGMHVTNGGEVVMTNTILVSHEIGILVDSGCTATLEATLWGSGPWANGTDWSSSGTILTGLTTTGATRPSWTPTAATTTSAPGRPPSTEG